MFSAPLSTAALIVPVAFTVLKLPVVALTVAAVAVPVMLALVRLAVVALTVVP